MMITKCSRLSLDDLLENVDLMGSLVNRLI